MALLTLDKLVNGMIVDADVKDRSGRLLLRAGSDVNDKTLKILRTWGVAEVSVRSDTTASANSADSSAQQVDAAAMATLTQQVDDMFQHNDLSVSTVATLRDIVLERLAARTQGKRA